MKNIHILPTDKPSRLWINTITGVLVLDEEPNTLHSQNIYITSDEKIKEGDLVLSKLNEVVRFGKKFNPLLYKKITLTTDPKLINDGVQGIDDEFLNWFVKNPRCEEVKVRKNPKVNAIVKGFGVKSFNNGYKTIIPKEEPKQITSLDGDGLGGIPKGVLTMLIGKKEETLEEAAVFKSHHSEEDFIRGGRWQQERMYSEEEVLELLVKMNEWPTTFNDEEEVKEWFEQFKKK